MKSSITCIEHRSTPLIVHFIIHASAVLNLVCSRIKRWQFIQQKIHSFCLNYRQTFPTIEIATRKDSWTTSRPRWTHQSYYTHKTNFEIVTCANSITTRRCNQQHYPWWGPECLVITDVSAASNMKILIAALSNCINYQRCSFWTMLTYSTAALNWRYCAIGNWVIAKVKIWHRLQINC